MNARRCGAVRDFIAGEFAADFWVPNSDFGSHRSAEFSGLPGQTTWRLVSAGTRC